MCLNCLLKKGLKERLNKRGRKILTIIISMEYIDIYHRLFKMARYLFRLIVNGMKTEFLL